MNNVDSVAQHVTGVDIAATIVVVIIVGISVLTLLGMGAMMAIGAIFSNRPLVTSWPAEQEQRFAVYENRGSASNTAAWVWSFLAAGLVAGGAVVVFFLVTPEKKDMTKGMNMSNISKRAKPEAAAPAPGQAPAQTPAAPADVPKATAPAEAPKGDSPPAPEAPKQ